MSNSLLTTFSGIRSLTWSESKENNNISTSLHIVIQACHFNLSDQKGSFKHARIAKIGKWD